MDNVNGVTRTTLEEANNQGEFILRREEEDTCFSTISRVYDDSGNPIGGITIRPKTISEKHEKEHWYDDVYSYA